MGMTKLMNDSSQIFKSYSLNQFITI